ncbi:hypothetical protein [Streptomyces sp. NPDC102264]|uniref:hypothetical protein n=1 Tax=Streptomyces sp. NPDC102264 TaxID=3366149 RepID=UPI0037F64719
MREEIDSQNGPAKFVVFAGMERWPAEDVYVISNTAAGGPVPMSPAQARAYAAALIRAADEAEGKPSVRRNAERRWTLPPDPEATQRTAANLDGRRPENQEDDDR